MIVDDSTRFSAITSCGMIKTNYAYNGTYSYIFTFGGAAIYIFYSPRSKLCYKIYTRSYFPDGRKLIKISADRGFLYYETSDFKDCLYNYKSIVQRFFYDFKDHFEDMRLLDNNLEQITIFDANTDKYVRR